MATYLVAKDKKCLHYYSYFIDEEFGLCYLRVPTWAPFRLQFYCNLHNWLATQLQQAGIENQLLDNAFVKIADWGKAQEIADGFDVAHQAVLSRAAAIGRGAHGDPHAHAAGFPSKCTTSLDRS